MQLSGELTEFALADILQILALGQKTGTLILKTESGASGLIVVMKGKIVQATTKSVRFSLGELLIQKGHLSRESLDQVLALQKQMDKPRPLGSLLAEMKLVDQSALVEAITEQIQNAISKMFTWRRGSFEVKLNAIAVGKGIHYTMMDYVHASGLSMEEVLLEAARCIDEARRQEAEQRGSGSSETIRLPAQDAEYISSVVPGPALTNPLPARPVSAAAEPQPAAAAAPERGLDAAPKAEPVEPRPARPREPGEQLLLESMRRLKDVMEQLRNITQYGEITLPLLRVAKEICSRGALLVLRDGELVALGHFGVGSDEMVADERAHLLAFRLNSDSIVGRALSTRRAQSGRLEPQGPDRSLVEGLGHPIRDSEAFAIPMVVAGKAQFVLFGDDEAGERPLGNPLSLEILAEHAAVVVDRLLMEKKHDDLQQARRRLAMKVSVST